MSKNELFERTGYLFVPNLIEDISKYQQQPLLDKNKKRVTGQIKYLSKSKFYKNNFVLHPVDMFVPGAFCRYNFPNYSELHSIIKNKIEKILDVRLLPTYYFDRFYFVGQELQPHVDRPACEVSVSLQVSSNHNQEPWPIWFKTLDGNEANVLMNDGDGVIYKGCECEHWRTSLPSRYNQEEKVMMAEKNIIDDTYHHQIFFHYVDSEGPFVEYAYDRKLLQLDSE
jgi:hypothetical protein